MNDSATAPHDFPQRLPIFDCHKEKLGIVSAFGVQSGYLVMRTGRLFHHDVSVPLSAIERSDAHGVYLNRTREEIHNLTLGGWSSLGNVDLNTGVGAGDDLDLLSVNAAPMPTGSQTTSAASQRAEPSKPVAT